MSVVHCQHLLGRLLDGETHLNCLQTAFLKTAVRKVEPLTFGAERRQRSQRERDFRALELYVVYGAEGKEEAPVPHSRDPSFAAILSAVCV